MEEIDKLKRKIKFLNGITLLMIMAVIVLLVQIMECKPL